MNYNTSVAQSRTRLYFFKTTRRYPYPGFEKHIKSVIRKSLTRLKQIRSPVPNPFPNEVTLEIGCLGSTRMKAINTQTRRKTKHTDILSFRYANTPVDGDITGALLLCHTAIEEKWSAEINDLGIKPVYTRLIIHGLAHLLGCDHIKAADAKRMSRMEKVLGLDTYFYMS